MDDEDLQYFHEWFELFLAPYYESSEYVQDNIRLKEGHTRRVCANSLHLAGELGLVRDQNRIAETSALFHDLGRFEQFRRYGTFDDRRSENHARLSVRLLHREGVLSRLSTPERRLVLGAVFFHNAYGLPGTDDGDRLLHMRLLRDADKLDIWNVVTSYYADGGGSGDRNPALELELPDTPGFSPGILEDIMACRQGRSNLVRSLNDVKLTQLSWVFDLNYVPSFRLLEKNGYAGKIIDSLDLGMDPGFLEGHIRDFIGRRIEELGG